MVTEKIKFIGSMLKIGAIGFGGGTALIPVIEKTVVDEQKLVSKDEYDEDIMIASITPGALPVEVAAGIGRRLYGGKGLLFGAIAMAMPGVLLTVLLLSLITNVSDAFLKQMFFVTLGVYGFICCLLTDYVAGTLQKSREEGQKYAGTVVFALVVALVSGKNICRILFGETELGFSLNTIQIFVLAFFIIFYTRCRFNLWNTVISLVFSVMFILCQFMTENTVLHTMQSCVYVGMLLLVLYGLYMDLRKGANVRRKKSFTGLIKNIGICLIFVIVMMIPAIALTKQSLPFAGYGFLSSIMSFGGGDAYLTVADGLFVGTEMISENEFYGMIIPLVNVLPGSILCKTLAGVGYYIGMDASNSVFGGILVAIAGFAVSVVASCIVFAVVADLYDRFGTLHVFQMIKIWIRPIVSGLLVNVMLSLGVQVRRQSGMYQNFYFSIGLMFVLFILDMVLYKKSKLKSMQIAAISVVCAVLVCNVM